MPGATIEDMARWGAQASAALIGKLLHIVLLLLDRLHARARRRRTRPCCPKKDSVHGRSREAEECRPIRQARRAAADNRSM